jgi:hypothetical protein
MGKCLGRILLGGQDMLMGS